MSNVRCQTADVGCHVGRRTSGVGMWDVGCGMWDIGCRMSDVKSPKSEVNFHILDVIALLTFKCYLRSDSCFKGTPFKTLYLTW